MTQAAPTQHIYFLLDRSGSMESIRHDVIGGFNSFLRDQQALSGSCLMTFIQFDSEDPAELLVDACPIAEVPELTTSTFVPRSGTPLYDAVGNLIMEAIVRCERRKRTGEPDESILFVIFTDGEENSSVHHDRQKILEMIEKREAAGWTFAYLGANQDAFLEGGKMGIAPGSVMPFSADSRGVARAFHVSSRAFLAYRRAVESGSELSPGEFFQEYAEADRERQDRMAKGLH